MDTLRERVGRSSELSLTVQSSMQCHVWPDVASMWGVCPCVGCILGNRFTNLWASATAAHDAALWMALRGLQRCDTRPASLTDAAREKGPAIFYLVSNRLTARSTRPGPE